MKKQVDDAENNLKKATESFKTAEKNLLNLLPNEMTVDTFRKVSKIDNVALKIETTESELTSAKQIKEKADDLRKRKPLSQLPEPEIPSDLTQVLSSTLDQVAFDAEQQIRAHLSANSKDLTIKWVGQGHSAQVGSKCPHCGQDMQELEIFNAYRAFFSGALQAQEELLNATKNKINTAFGEAAQTRFRETRTNHKNEHVWWRDAAAYKFELPLLRDDKVVLEIMANTFNILNEVLTRKQANRGSVVDFTEEELLAFDTWNRVVLELQKYNDELKHINELLDKQKTDADSIDLSPIQKLLKELNLGKERHEQKVVAAYEAYDTAKKDQEDARLSKKEANDRLRSESERFLNQYSAHINELLELFAVEFRIVDEGVNFKGGAPSGQLVIELNGTRISSDRDDALDPSQPSLANTLSGGDRSTLALAFFLAMVELEPGIGNSIVVFDDPYHNQDRSRQQCTIEQIHHVVDISRQCFVLSHDLEFARAVEKKMIIPKKAFIIKPLANKIELKAKELPLLPSQAYKKDYCLLRDYIQNPERHLEHLKYIASRLRPILEDYFRIKFPLSWVENEWLGDMIQKIREADQKDPLYFYQRLHEEISDINTYSKPFHHASRGEQADEPEARELKAYAERTLKIIHQ